MENNKRDAIDWATMATIIGLLLTVTAQTVHLHERLTKIETQVDNQTSLCDCFNTRVRIGELEQRVHFLEKKVDN